ncbi:MAG: bile acid:sodium symporter family protein [Paludibacteraceae bacterium]|nr:bile acid:sodium symporter family protein [Paludibacteraceae bacterium]
MRKVCKFITDYMSLIVLVAAASAFFFPKALSFIETSFITPLLGIIMFGMGLTINLSDLKTTFGLQDVKAFGKFNIKVPCRNIIIGTVAQFLIMPLLAWFLVKIFSLPPELAVGVILVGCCPGGTSSNVITYLAGGDLTLSVGMTTVNTLLAPLLTPILVWLFAGTLIEIDFWGMFLSIAQIILLPIALGMVFQRFFPDTTLKIKDYLPAISTIAITAIVIAVVAANASALATSGLIIIAVVLLHNTLGYALGYVTGKLFRLGRPQCIAMSVEIGMQNSGLACSMAAIHFATMPLATVPGAIFSVWHNISGALYARILNIHISVAQYSKKN